MGRVFVFILTPIQKMCFPTHRIHDGCFGHGVVAKLVIDRILDLANLSLLGIFPEKKFLLVGVVDLHGANADTPESIPDFQQLGNARFCFAHTFVMNITVEVGVTVGIEPKLNTFMLAVLDT